MASASKPAPSDDGMSIKTGASKRSMRSYAESVRAAKEKAASEKPDWDRSVRIHYKFRLWLGIKKKKLRIEWLVSSWMT